MGAATVSNIEFSYDHMNFQTPETIIKTNTERFVETVFVFDIGLYAHFRDFRLYTSYQAIGLISEEELGPDEEPYERTGRILSLGIGIPLAKSIR